MLAPIVRVLVLVLISKRRYTDVVLRSRRSEPLSPAAELQWDLLPPLTCSTPSVSVSGILEPAYSIGGDSFDYALNPKGAELAIVDAMGHGMAAVLLSVTAINGLRNARREGIGLEEAYLRTGDTISEHLGGSAFVTGQLASLDLPMGDLTWLNAGHPLPLLVRDGSYVGELTCRPSLPMGLGGVVMEIATERLQPGDRVLFYTDGVVETRGPDGEQFGLPRLTDLLVRASREEVRARGDRSAPLGVGHRSTTVPGSAMMPRSSSSPTTAHLLPPEAGGRGRAGTSASPGSAVAPSRVLEHDRWREFA